jgi:acyl-coenzyme A synthetase/AMP-(fatty) acid ligase
VLQAVFSSGGPLPPEAAADALRHTGRSPIEVFGSSETGGIAWRQRAVQADRWTALPGIAWRLQDGFLAVRSPHLADDDWYVCADRALPAGDDSFVLAGRADRIVKIEEKRVSLTQIEQRLAASPLVREARVVMVELDVGTRVAAAVVPGDAGQALLDTHGRAALTAALRAQLADAVDPVALPRRWAFVPALPCNAQGKTTEAMLRDLFRRTVPAAHWLDAEANSATSATAALEVTDDLAIFDGHSPIPRSCPAWPRWTG